MPLNKLRSFISRTRPTRSNSISSMSSLSSIGSFSCTSFHSPNPYYTSAYPLPPTISITDYEASISPPASPRSSLELSSRPTTPSSLSKETTASSKESIRSRTQVTNALTTLLDSHLPTLEEHYVNLLALSSYPSSLRGSQSYISQKHDTVAAVSRLLAEMEEQVQVLDDAGLDGEEVVGEVERRMEGLVGLVRGMGKV